MQGQLSNRLREHDAELTQPLNHHESLLYMQIIFSRCPPLSLSLSLSLHSFAGGDLADVLFPLFSRPERTSDCAHSQDSSATVSLSSKLVDSVDSKLWQSYLNKIDIAPIR